MNINTNFCLSFGNQIQIAQKNPTPNCEKSKKSFNPEQMPNVYYLHPSMNFCAGPKDKVQNLTALVQNNDCHIGILQDIESLDDSDSKEFIKEYCKHTGFPNLEKVNSNMKAHAIDTLQRASVESGAKLLWSGFHKHCSGSCNLALPGSDLDAMGVIVDGSQYNIDNFKGFLWNNFDPSLVSIRKDFEFPDVFSIDQLYEWTQIIDKIVETSSMRQKTFKYTDNMKEISDYETALEFNIDIARQIEKYSKEELSEFAPSVAKLISYGETPKNITQSMSSALESLRSGNCLIQEDKLTPGQRRKFDSIKNSSLYKYGNICIQDAPYGIKDKLYARKNFINEDNFSKLSEDKQKDLILRMLYESYPSWSKSKIDANWADELNYLFDNGDNVNESRDRAFRQTVDS